MTIIIGINAYHGDASACIVRDGVLLAAAEEERFRRIKHWAGFPSMAIRYCMEEAGVTLEGVDHVAINQDGSANLWRKAAFVLARRPDLGLILDRLRNKRERAGVREELAEHFPGQRFAGELHEIEHHLAHLGSAYLVSPFSEAVALSVDGFGDFASAAWAVCRNDAIEVEGKVHFPHSLGIFYQALTQYLGFPRYGDEYKVMGLAPYGKPLYLEEMRRIVRLEEDGSFALNLAYFRHHREKIDYQWSGGEPGVGALFSAALIDLLGPARAKSEELTQRHRDIARSVQAMYEEAFFHMLRGLHRCHGLDSVALAGGCAMNSVANGKIRANTPFKQVYVQSAAGDAGGAIGAAFVVSGRLGAPRNAQARRPPSPLEGGKVCRPYVMDHAYYGPAYSREQIAALLAYHAQELDRAVFTVAEIGDEQELCTQVAGAIANGQVIGWFQGRMEWGPRALGNRSILGDPRRADMKDILNLKIKRRESFRPFAPSILREAVADWFETDDDVPFMMQVHQIREAQRARIPAVTHVDGSGRLQTVYRQTNPRYHRLIEAFHAITGVPLVLNTSFNENEPVVCTPGEALNCFLRTRMDVLVLGDFLISRVGDAQA
jgi:carbamoyltransferase